MPLDEMGYERWYVVSALAQRWDGDPKHVQTEVQILSKASFFYRSLEVLIRCGNEP